MHLIYYVSERDLVYVGISEKNFLLRNAHQRIVGKLLARIISLYVAELCAGVLIAVLIGCTQQTILTGRLDVVAEKLFLCHFENLLQVSVSFPLYYSTFI